MQKIAKVGRKIHRVGIATSNTVDMEEFEKVHLFFNMYSIRSMSKWCCNYEIKHYIQLKIKLSLNSNELKLEITGHKKNLLLKIKFQLIIVF